MTVRRPIHIDPDDPRAPSEAQWAELTPEERAHLGISDELIRFCIGIEDTEDLLADLVQALDQI